MAGRILAVALGALALFPAASQAATCTVGTGGTYLTIGAALADRACTDIQVQPGSYREAPLTLSRSSTTISAAPGSVTVTSTGPTVLTVSGSDDTVRGLTLDGGTALRVTGARAVVDRVGATGTAAAVEVTGNAAKVLRSVLRGGADAASALLVRATTSADRTATVDSSILSGGAGGAGLRARSESGGTNGRVAVTLVHATIAGAARAALLESGAVPGRVTAKASRSIVHGTLGGMTVDASTDLATPDASLFRDPAGRDLRLRADAPVIDKGGAVGSGESDQDVEGQPRLAGAATDLGADEFHNQAPTAALAANRPRPRQNATVTFDASASVDPEAAYGGGLVRFEWDFGDGTTDTSTTPTIDHLYTDVGRYPVTVQVVDAQGATTASAPLTIRVRDGIPPRLRFIHPHPGATLVGAVRRRFSGTATDRNGVRAVSLSLRQTKLSNGRRPRGRCRYIDPRTRRYVYRSCAHPLFFRVSSRRGRWHYDTHARFFLRPGRWQATIRATDGTGNRATRTVKFAVV